MMDEKKRDIEIIRLRPNIPAIVNNEKTTEIERFQNETIRPIIKLQHDTLVSILLHYLRKYKVDFINLTEENRTVLIQNIFAKDLKFRHIVIGLVIGLFSMSELTYYFTNEQEANKRIMNIVKQRIFDWHQKSAFSAIT